MVAVYREALDDCSAELASIRERVNKDQFDSMVKFLQRYAIIKACGTIERVIKSLIADYVEQHALPETQQYLETKVRESSTNPKTSLISALLGDFCSDWKSCFDDNISGHNQEKQSLNSLVQLRNDFAHGKSPNTSINTIIRYFDDAKNIVSIVDQILLTPRE